jgi:hypothetical protein
VIGIGEGCIGLASALGRARRHHAAREPIVGQRGVRHLRHLAQQDAAADISWSQDEAFSDRHNINPLDATSCNLV